MGPVNEPATRRLLPIGELSRASGLTVSALRFYDRQGLLVPADVDPHTGYRRYSPSQVRLARLLAGMRRVGMPLAEMAAVLSALPDAEVAEDLLTAHLRRLENGLVDARREVERLQSLLPGSPLSPWTAQVESGELVRALNCVRYAVGDDPDFPMLHGVLVEPTSDMLRLVATDRYRLAVAEAPATLDSHATGGASLLPTALVDRLHHHLGQLGEQVLVQLQLSRSRLVLVVSGDHVLDGDCLDMDFPDYRRLLQDDTCQDAASLRLPVADILAALPDEAGGATLPDRVLLHQNGIGAGGWDEDGDAEGDGAQGILVDRAFLWESASAAPDGHAVLPLGEQFAPLTFRGSDDRVVGLLMPVRPEPTP